LILIESKISPSFFLHTRALFISQDTRVLQHPDAIKAFEQESEDLLDVRAASTTVAVLNLATDADTVALAMCVISLLLFFCEFCAKMEFRIIRDVGVR
jgi:hypothetical protein